LVCADCHGTVALKDATHMNGVTNFNWGAAAKYNSAVPNYDQASGTCSNVYCHGAAMPGTDTSGTNRTPSWKTPFMPATLTPASCKTCHGFPPVNVNHPVITSPTSFPTAACTGCHPNVSAAGTTYADIFVVKSQHINGAVEVTTNCNGCHGYPPSNKRFKGTQNNWSSARIENYSSGGGAHTVAGHISPTADPKDAWVNCSKCHNQNDHAMNPLQFLPSTNIKVSIDQKFRFSVDRAAKYTSNKLDGAAHVPGNCSSVSCHFQKTPQW
jgi:predicted CxxxxCH...CXXCH cytochrome family protein